MKAFRATGSFTIKKQGCTTREQPFSIEIAAKDEADATHTILSTIGSKQRVEKKYITISELVPLKNDEITDHVIKHQIGGA
jgi:ribosomal protein L20A (L18A)